MGASIQLDDKVWRSVIRELEKTDGAYVKVGVLASKGGDVDYDGISMIELAVIHEFGSPAANIPERSFIRRTFEVKAADLRKIQARLAGLVATRKATIADVLEVLGSWGATEVKKTITTGAGVPPPNAPATIAAKGSDRPLVDTGRLVGAITWEVVT